MSKKFILRLGTSLICAFVFYGFGVVIAAKFLAKSNPLASNVLLVALVFFVLGAWLGWKFSEKKIGDTLREIWVFFPSSWF